MLSSPFVSGPHPSMRDPAGSFGSLEGFALPLYRYSRSSSCSGWFRWTSFHGTPSFPPSLSSACALPSPLCGRLWFTLPRHRPSLALHRMARGTCHHPPPFEFSKGWFMEWFLYRSLKRWVKHSTGNRESFTDFFVESDMLAVSGLCLLWKRRSGFADTIADREVAESCWSTNLHPYLQVVYEMPASTARHYVSLSTLVQTLGMAPVAFALQRSWSSADRFLPRLFLVSVPVYVVGQVLMVASLHVSHSHELFVCGLVTTATARSTFEAVKEVTILLTALDDDVAVYLALFSVCEKMGGMIGSTHPMGKGSSQCTEKTSLWGGRFELGEESRPSSRASVS